MDRAAAGFALKGGVGISSSYQREDHLNSGAMTTAFLP